MSGSLFDARPFDVAQAREGDDVDARIVACPTCGQPAGSPCKRPSGHSVFGGGHHALRIRAAKAVAR